MGSQRVPQTRVDVAAAFSGPAVDYLPKPDNDPIQVEAGDFEAPDEATVKQFRLGVEIAKRRIMDSDRKAGAK